MRGRLVLFVGILTLLVILTIGIFTSTTSSLSIVILGIISGVFAILLLSQRIGGSRLSRLVILVFLTLLIITVAFLIATGNQVSRLNVALPSRDLLVLSSAVVIVAITLSCVVEIRSRRNLIEERLGRFEVAEQEALSQGEQSNYLDSFDEILQEKRLFGKSWFLPLVQADSRLTLNEYLWLHCLCFIVGYVLSFFLVRGNTMVALIVGTAGFFVPRVYFGLISDQRVTDFRKQLGETLLLLTNALRSGYSLIQAIEALSRSTPEPTSTEFKRLVQEVQLGIDLHEAFNNLLSRTESEDLKLMVVVVNIQRDIGGNLAEILGAISSRIRWRLKLGHDVLVRFKPLYRVYFLALYCMIIIEWKIAPEYFDASLTTPAGRAIILVAYALVSLAVLTSANANQRVRELRREIQGLWYTFRTTLLDVVCGSLLILTLVLMGVPHVLVLWLSVLLLCINLKYPFLILILFLPAVLLAVVTSPGSGQYIDLFLSEVDRVAANVFGGFSSIASHLLSGLSEITVLNFSTIAIIAGLGVTALALIYVGFKDNRLRDPLQERLAQFSEREVPETLREIETSLSTFDRVLLPLLRRIAAIPADFHPTKRVEDIDRDIDMAGLVGELGPATVISLQIIGLLALGLCAVQGIFSYGMVQYPGLAVITILIAFAAGYLLPHLWLRWKATQRRQKVLASLPASMDLLVICVEAGLGITAGMGQIYEKWGDDVLALEFGRVLREIQLGKLPREAFRDLAERNNFPELYTFVTAITQADQLGSGFGAVLRIEADQLRTRQQQRVEDKLQTQIHLTDFALALMLAPGVLLWLVTPVVTVIK